MSEPYLIANPPRQRQFRARNEKPSGLIVVHTAESTPDWVGHDSGAEAVAQFIQGRTDFGSYHVVVDSDSILPLVPFSLAAYGDGTGSNEFAIHISAATQAHKWNSAPKEWREETARNMGVAAGRAALWYKNRHNGEIPAWRVSREESEQRLPGFISHAERDPARRSDPGKDFPWSIMFEEFKQTVNPPAKTPNITLALRARSAEDRRRALRKVMRHGDPRAQRLAERWLKSIVVRERAMRRIKKARESLKGIEVK